jgi:L-2,4-diaminobutyrate decarboxylase
MGHGMTDSSFEVNRHGLEQALDWLEKREFPEPAALPAQLAQSGIGEKAALDLLAPLVFDGATRLDLPHAFAHMDPPTPWISWATTLWNARLNQNLLHPASAPFARAAERQAVSWLAPYFGMEGGHMTPGSTLANLTALWAARDITGARRIVASDAAHLSIAKSAKILGLKFETVPTDENQRMDAEQLSDDLSDAILVLTAGTTSAGAIDPLSLCGRGAWTHVDAAWAGPLVFSRTHATRLNGMDRADSIAVSAHKWLFQPKESALVLFRDEKRAHDAISFGGNYLAASNIGVLGSHGAVAIPLLATLLAWGRTGLAERIDRCMAAAASLADVLANNPGWLVFAEPETGVVLFRPTIGNCEDAFARLPSGLASTTRIGSETWLRCVAANPNVDIAAVLDAILKAA